MRDDTKVMPVYFVDDDDEPREFEDLGDGLAMRTPQDPGEPQSMDQLLMEPQKVLELRDYFLQSNPGYFEKYQNATKDIVPGYESESEYEIEQLTNDIDDYARFAADGVPIDQSVALQSIFDKYKSNMDKLRPEPQKSEPFGEFTLDGVNYKSFGNQWKVLEPDGTPMSPGKQFEFTNKRFNRDNNGTRYP